MHQNNRIFEEIFKKNCDCIVVIDEDGKVVLWNEACKDLLGYTSEEVLGKDVHRLLCSNEDYDRAKKALENFKKTGDSPLSGKILHVSGYTKSGRRIKIIMSLSRINLETKTYFAGILRKTDYLMTIPTDSTISIDELLDVIPVPIFIKDRNLRYIHVNSAFEEFTGIKRIDAKGKTVFELYPPELAKVYNVQDLKILDRPEKQIYSFKMIKKDGSTREVEFHKASFTDKSGKVAGILGAYIDVQERNELMRKLIYEKEKAEDALQAKSRFISYMSHELRTPLSNIIGYTNLLLTSEGINQTQEESLRNIKNMAESLMSILTDLLELSKLESHTLKIKPEETNLPELIFDVVDNLKFECYLKGLEFYLHISPILPERVIVDRLRLKQILINLVSNAIKYTKRGFVELSIVCDKTNMPPNKTKVRFTVADSGVGIGEEEIKKIFEPFYRVEDKMTKQKFGTGIGLYLSKKLLQLMGSDIHVISTPRKGSKFYFDLIFEIVEDSSEENFERYKDKRVLLIVDLDKRFVSLMNYLIYWGMEFTIPSKERDFIEIMESNQKFDFLILDNDVKYINIDRVIDRIIDSKKAEKIENVVIIIKPTENIEQIHSKFSSLADIYLQKPINPRRLISALDRNYSDRKQEKMLESPYLSLEPLKILIVDDIETNRRIIKYLLQKVLPKAEIFETDNGESAVIIQRSSKPDVIFMDIQMPRMDGYEAAEIIKKENSKSIIVGLSAFTGQEERQKALRAGFDFYLVKPLTLRDLRKVFTNLPTTETKPKADEIGRIDFHYFEENQLDSDFIKNILKLSLDTIPYYVEEIKNSFINRDFEKLKKAAHKLKGSSYSAGLTSIAKIAEMINRAENFDQNSLQNKIDLLVKEWHETEKEIRDYLDLK